MPKQVARRRRKATSAKPEHTENLRTSERKSVNRCRQRWEWGYDQGLRPHREAPALRFGTLIHRSLEHYYGAQNQARRRPTHPAVTFKRLYSAELEETEREWPDWRDQDDDWHTYFELGVAMLEGYIEKWKHSAQYNDKEYLVLATEQRFYSKIRVPRGEPRLAPPSPTVCVGTFDRILYHVPSRRLLFGDYKTTKNDPTKNPWLSLDEQAGTYWAYGPAWLALEAPDALRHHMQRAVAHLPREHRKAVEELRFDGILYDFLKKDLPDDRWVNEDGYAVNKPKKEELLARAKKEGLPWRGLKVNELIDVIDGAFGEGHAYKFHGEVSKKQPGPLFHREVVYRDEGDRRNVLRRVYEDAKEIGMMRRGELAIKKSPDQFICIGCQFRDMCELHETGADWKAFRDAMYSTWSPYSSYEVDADELE